MVSLFRALIPSLWPSRAGLSVQSLRGHQSTAAPTSPHQAPCRCTSTHWFCPSGGGMVVGCSVHFLLPSFHQPNARPVTVPGTRQGKKNRDQRCAGADIPACAHGQGADTGPQNHPSSVRQGTGTAQTDQGGVAQVTKATLRVTGRAACRAGVRLGARGQGKGGTGSQIGLVREDRAEPHVGTTLGCSLRATRPAGQERPPRPS